jgi:hypothetical protein
MLLGSSLHHFPDGAARVDKVMSVSPFYFLYFNASSYFYYL